jgi:hypothetical protein
MTRNDVLMVGGLALSLTLLTCSNGLADPVVYKETCGDTAHDSWNLTCKVERNTVKDYPFERIKSITICASFDNHGGFNSPATVVHNKDDGDQYKPTDLFDMVKFQGSEVTNTVTWIGTGSRRDPKWTMRGEFRLASPDKISGTYTETLSQGQRQIGEIRSTCTQLPDENP